jgi:membrane-bound lytic murein transglycosylase F
MVLRRWAFLGVILLGAPGGEAVPNGNLPPPPSPVLAPSSVAGARTDADDPEIAEVAAPADPPPREWTIDVGDLAAVQARGVLRILVQGHGEDLLPRDGASSRLDREMAEAFAAHLGVKSEVLMVDRFEDLIPFLLQGKGDVVAGRLTVTTSRKDRVAFSRPVLVVDELLVHKRGAPALAEASGLSGQTVHVLAASAHEETLNELRRAGSTSVNVQTVSGRVDEHDLASDVARGTIAFTVVDSDMFSHLKAYNPEVEAAMVLRRGREIALGLRPQTKALKAALDAFLVQRALTQHATTIAAIDLDEIKKRGSLRVLTRNDAVSYFLHKGEQLGFDYAFLTLFANAHGLRLDVVVPPHPDDLVPWLLEGRGDVIAAFLPSSPALSERLHVSPPYGDIAYVIVEPARSPPAQTLESLAGRTCTVSRRTGPFAELQSVAQRSGMVLVAADDARDGAGLVDDVARGASACTIVDTAVVLSEVATRTDVRVGLTVLPRHAVVLGSRPHDATLAAALDAFVRSHVRTTADGRVVGSAAYNVLKQTYLAPRRRPATTDVVDARHHARISRYDELMQRRAAQYGLDWRLMAAQAFQESRFDPMARSWVGAQGLFQVMPATGREMGFHHLSDPDEGVHAGVRYMAWLVDQFDTTLPLKQRLRFALASYNAGKGHVDDARRLAAELGLDPNRWFGHTEKAMLLLQEPRYSRRARYGYVRGTEPVKYVSEIQSRYDNYITIVPTLAPSSTSAPSPTPRQPKKKTTAKAKTTKGG